MNWPFFCGKCGNVHTAVNWPVNWPFFCGKCGNVHTIPFNGGQATRIKAGPIPFVESAPRDGGGMRAKATSDVVRPTSTPMSVLEPSYKPRTEPIVDALWILPRPRRDCYVGSFPLHFEQKLWRLLGQPARVLHPFGGLSEIGDSVDLNESTSPTWVGDAHDLHWIADDTYDLVILDPPYSDEEAAWLYSTPPLKPGKFQAEACRVTRPGGHVAIYHRHQPKRPADGWTLTHRIVVLTRTGHAPRVCFVYRKPEAA